MKTQNVYAQAMDFARKGLDTILPPRCPITGESVDYQGAISASAWRYLNFITAPYCKKCGIPFSFNRQEEAENQGENGEICLRCMEKPPLYDCARACMIYDDMSRFLILGFKHGDKTYLARNFAPWMQNSGREFLSKTDAIIPVPLHRSRLRARRYNQAVILSAGLEKITGIRCYHDALIRTRATPSQGRLSTKERHKNVRKAFSVRRKYIDKLKGKNVVLMDDVYTTGATVNECTKALKTAGVKEVYVLTLARVVKDNL